MWKEPVEFRPGGEDPLGAIFVPTAKFSILDGESLELATFWAIHFLPDFSTTAQTLSILSVE
jgi:hypothetical protein